MTGPTRTLVQRGGAAAGGLNTVATGTYASIPPSSTYTGPTVAGSYGGFVGVLVGSGIALLLVLLILFLLRLRSLRRRNATYDARGDAEAAGGVHGWAEEHNDAFEMPSSLRTPGGGHGYAAPGAPYSPSESVLHLSPSPGGGGGSEGEHKLYANEGIVSQEAFFDEDEARRYAEGGDGEGSTTASGGRRSTEL